MDLVTVAAFNSAAAAEMAKNYLANEGVTAYVEDSATGDMLHLTAPFGEVKLQVASPDAEQAAELLRNAEHHERTESEPEESDA
jgi:hypothetical protein